MFKNWRTKLASSVTGLWGIVPLLTDGITPSDIHPIGMILGGVATIWFLRDAVQKSGPAQ